MVVQESPNVQTLSFDVRKRVRLPGIDIGHNMTLQSARKLTVGSAPPNAVKGYIKLALDAGKANPAPPVGPALGAKVRQQCCALLSCADAGLDILCRSPADSSGCIALSKQTVQRADAFVHHACRA